MIFVYGAVAAILGFLGFAATRPDHFRVERKGHVKASPDRVFAKISDFHQWKAWSPWEGIDPTMKTQHSGPPSGTGAVYEWEGNSKVGKGRMEITGVEPPRKVNIKLDFLKPFEAHNLTEFSLEPREGGTDVTWVMSGPSPFMSKVMGVFMNMDKLIGRDFEKGLANLKRETEV